MNIQPKDSAGGSGETRESLVARQATEMLDKLPADYVPFEVRHFPSNTTYLVLSCARSCAQALSQLLVFPSFFSAIDHFQVAPSFSFFWLRFPFLLFVCKRNFFTHESSAPGLNFKVRVLGTQK